MKIFKNFIFASSLVIAASGAGLVLTGCNDDDENLPAHFKADNREFTLEYDGLTAEGIEPTLTLNSSGNWSVTQKDEWIHLSHESGTRGSHAIFVTADLNTGEQRRGFVEIQLLGKNKTELIAVTQNKKVDALKLSTNLFEVATLGESIDGEPMIFTIETNCDWSMALPDWLTADKSSGSAGKAVVTLTAAVNTTGESREAKVNVTAGSLTRSITVKQDGSAFNLVPDTPLASGKIIFDASNPAPFTAKVDCIEAWTLTEKPAWVTVSPDNGAEGETAVTVTAETNTGDAREGVITLTSAHGVKITVPVSQKTDKIYPDDKAVGFVYFSDDFSWAVGGADQVSNINGGKPNDARNIYTWDYAGNGFPDVLKSFNERFIDLNAGEKTIYSMDGYLKFNAGNKQTAIKTKKDLDIAAGRYADVDVTFRACKNGTDKVTVTVVIEGEGEIVDGVSLTQSKAMEPFNNSDKNIPWTWTDMKVTVKGATANTKIIIGATQFIDNDYKKVSGYYRWFMDDLKVTRIETK